MSFTQILSEFIPSSLLSNYFTKTETNAAIAAAVAGISGSGIPVPQSITITVPYTANTGIEVTTYDITQNIFLVFINGIFTTQFKYVDATHISLDNDISGDNGTVVLTLVKLTSPDSTRTYNGA